jgi:hypothetical protein
MSKVFDPEKTQPLERGGVRDRRRVDRRGDDRRKRQLPVDVEARRAQRRLLKRRIEDQLLELDLEI